jgi:hypothetical protein
VHRGPRANRLPPIVKFFVPAASTPEQAEEVWNATRKFAGDTMAGPIGARRIFRLSYLHKGKRLTAEVGQPEPLTGEPVVVILDSNPYLVCTQDRGVVRGTPVLVGRGAVSEVVDFD